MWNIRKNVLPIIVHAPEFQIIGQSRFKLYYNLLLIVECFLTKQDYLM